MELTGKVIKILESKSGTSAKGDWTKHSFVIETSGQYPKKIALEMFGNGQLAFVEGDTISCNVEIESREWQGKWFTNAKAFGLKVVGSESPQKPKYVSDPESQKPKWAETKSSESTNSLFANASGDDLPF